MEFNGGGVLIFPNTFVDLPNGMQSCNNIWLGMGTLYAATPGQSPGVARIYIYIYYIPHTPIGKYVYIIYWLHRKILIYICVCRWVYVCIPTNMHMRIVALIFIFRWLYIHRDLITSCWVSGSVILSGVSWRRPFSLETQSRLIVFKNPKWALSLQFTSSSLFK